MPACKLLGSDAIIGLSSHSAAQLAPAAGEPVDYVALGPVFITGSKRQPDAVVGLEEIRRCRGLVEKPLVAIGGITLENARDVWTAGADSVAVIAGLLPAAASARSLRERMEEWGRAARL
jgi:thiamine-phosphate pyrophosphorylase